jgi:RNA polymerase-binding protein DksA
MALTPTELKRLQHALEERQAVLVAEVRDDLRRSGERQYIEIAGRVMDIGEASVADLLADLNTAMIERQVHELRDIEAAQARIHDGSYGVCIDCGGEIGVDRLKAYPTAKRCIGCQSQRERAYGHGSTPSL